MDKNFNINMDNKRFVEEFTEAFSITISVTSCSFFLSFQSCSKSPRK